MISQHMKYYLNRVHMGLYHVQFSKINYVGRTCSMDEKCRGLTVISVSSYDTICLGEIEIP